jgi:methylenetetrahydrofolate reductase (NADPH)
MALGLPSVMPGGTVSVHETMDALLASGGRSFSFEFFPPKDATAEAVLWESVRRVEQVSPTFVSVTYGAGGSTRDNTVRVTRRIAEETTLTPVAHLTCVSASRAELRQVVGAYADAGVRNVMALRGDPPGGVGQPWVRHPHGLDHADELVAMLGELGRFCVGVAAFPERHPESSDLEQDARVLVAKQRAGARFAVTQFFFDVEDYLRLRDFAVRHGCTMPIIPGLIPVTSLKQVPRLQQLSNGARMPADLVGPLQAAGDDPAAARRAGIEAATVLADRLLAEGAPGLHLYTMNRSTATLEIYAALGLGREAARAGAGA